LFTNGLLNQAVAGKWHSLRVAAQGDGQGLGRTVSRALQRQDQWRYSRSWLLLANPALAHTITEAIDEGWITDLNQLSKLKPLAGERPIISSKSRKRWCATRERPRPQGIRSPRRHGRVNRASGILIGQRTLTQIP
jgi:hypothetical protein